jgi:hypothetical protein
MLKNYRVFLGLILVLTNSLFLVKILKIIKIKFSKFYNFLFFLSFPFPKKKFFGRRVVPQKPEQNLQFWNLIFHFFQDRITLSKPKSLLNSIGRVSVL